MRKLPIEPYMNADKIQTMHFTRNSAIEKNSLQNFKKLTLVELMIFDFT